MFTKILLILTAVAFAPYGAMCLLDPSTATGYAGLNMTNGDAFIEISAMYGGLQLGFGLLCLFGALKPNFSATALIAIVFAIGGLALGRTLGLMVSEQAAGAYTFGALAFEWTITVLAAIALKKSAPFHSQP